MPTETRSSQEAPISFEAELSTIEDTTLVRLPKDASEQLPSRGQVAVRASLGGHDFETVVEQSSADSVWQDGSLLYVSLLSLPTL